MEDIQHFKKVVIQIFVISLPFLFGFNSLFFSISILVVYLHFAYYNKSLFLFYFLVFFYKYSGNQFGYIDKGFLNVISLFLSFYYFICYFYSGSYRRNNQFPFLIFSLYLILNSIFNSKFPGLSLNKSISFVIHSIALIYIVEKHWKTIIELLINIAILLVFTSIILPKSLVNFTTLNLHCGILNQSQAYGYIMAMILPIQLIHLQKTNHKKIYLLILLLSVFFIFLSGMRSAFLVVLAFLVILFASKKFVSWKRYIYFTLVIIICYIFFIDNSFFEKLFDKRGVELDANISSFQEMYESRNKLATPSVENFENHPVFGIGFGLPTEITDPNFDFTDRWGVKYFPGSNIIISFPVEKGVLYTAILEEIGLFGMFLFLFFLSMFIKINNFNIFQVLLIVSVLIISLGEASLFSPNGIGLFSLLNLQISRFLETTDYLS